MAALKATISKQDGILASKRKHLAEVFTEDNARCLAKAVTVSRRNQLCHTEHQASQILSEVFALQRVARKGSGDVTPAQALIALKMVLAVLDKGEAQLCIQKWRCAAPGEFQTSIVEKQITEFWPYYR